MGAWGYVPRRTRGKRTERVWGANKPDLEKGTEGVFFQIRDQTLRDREH